MVEWAGVRRCRRVCVCMPKKTHYWKQVVIVSETARSCTAIRTSVASLLLMTADSTRSCPCLTCSIKIVQVGITEVVYSRSYHMDTAVMILLKSFEYRTEHPVDCASIQRGWRTPPTIFASGLCFSPRTALANADGLASERTH